MVRIRPIPPGPLKGLDDFLLEYTLEEFLARDPLKRVSIDLKATFPAPEYAVQQLVPEGEVTLLGGHGGAGKSILALTLAAHYAAGEAWAGCKVKGRRAVYDSHEDPASLTLHRLKRICEVYELPADKVIKNLTILDGSDGDSALCTEVSEFGVRSIKMTDLFDEVAEACQGAGLIVIDNASDTYEADENSRRQVRQFIRSLKSLARKNNAGLLLLAHIDKAAAKFGGNGNAYSGSTAWHNSVRSRLALTVEKDGRISLAQEKLNIGKQLEQSLPLSWQDGVLVPGSSNEAQSTEAAESINKIAVLTAIEAAIADGEDVPTARSGPKTTQGALERYPDLPDYLRGKRGRDAFYSALTALHRDRKIRIEEFTTASRHVRERFTVDSAPVAPVAPNPPYPPAEPAHPRRRSAGCADSHEPAQPAQSARRRKY